MASDLMKSLSIASSGMHAQSERLRMVSENIANADTTGLAAGENPYRRKTIFFKDELNRDLDARTVKVSRYGTDKSDFVKRYEPSHPAADENGYVMYPNVNPMVEMMDMREARVSYEANMNVIETSKGLIQQTINMLKN